METLYSYYRGSGSNTPDSVDWRFELDFSYNTDYANNCDVFTTSLYLKMYGALEPQSAYFTGQILVDNQQQNVGKTISWSAGTHRYLIGAKTFTVVHNPDGTKGCNVQGKGAILNDYYIGISIIYVTLPNIPRYANITGFSASNGGLDKINVSWSADSDCSAVYYSTDNGQNWSGSVGSGTSGSFVITSVSPGNTYPVKLQIVRRDSGLPSYSSNAINITTTDKNKITSTNFNVSNGGTLTVTAVSAGGYQCDVYIELLNDDKTARIGNTIRHANTLNTTFTVAEINSLLQYIPDKKTCNFRINILTVVNGTDSYNDIKDGLYTVVNSDPTMEMFNVQPNDAATQTLMGWTTAVNTDNGKIIQGKTQLKINLGVVTLKNYATFKKYIITAGGQTYETTSSSFILPIGLSANGNITVDAIDSRTNKVSKTFSYILTPYSNPTISNYYIDRLDLPNNDLSNLKFNVKIAKVMKDTSQYTLSYKYKKTSDPTYSGSITLSPSSIDTEGNINFDKNLTTIFDLGSAYDVQIKITDYFNTNGITQDLLLNKDAPENWIGKDMVSFLGLAPDGATKGVFIAGNSVAAYITLEEKTY